jgi:hypothetical protein
MASINIKVTATMQEFSTFADELGYQTEVLKSPEELALLAEPISIQDRIKPNPQNKQQFLETYFNALVADELYKQKARVIDAEINAAKQAEKEAIRTTLRGKVSVTSQA